VGVLENALNNHFLIGAADPTVRSQIIRAVERHDFAAGDEIIRQGESGEEADKFYILEIGKTSVLKGGEEVYVYEEGSCFGDIALLYDCPRNATVVCKEAATVWTISRATFRAVLSQNDAIESDACRAAIGQVEILAGLTDSQVDAVADALVKMTFKKGDLIMKKGEAGELFYFLSDGEVAVREIQDKDTGEEILGVTIKSGSKRSYFGEHALLANEPRGATIQVESDTCTCLALDRDDFDHVLGPLQEVLHQNTIVNTCTTKIPAFRCMTGYERETLSECMVVSEVGNGDIIIKQDDESATFTIILKGEAATEGKTDKIYFGELGLLDTVCCAPADVVAQGPVTIAQISRKVFNQELGVTLEEIKSRDNLFTTADADGSGGIDIAELQNMAARNGTVLTSDEAGEIMAGIDTDGNGVIDQEEFSAWLNKNLDDRRHRTLAGKFGGSGGDGVKFGGGGSFLNFGGSADLGADMKFEDLEVRQVIGSGNFGRVSIAKNMASGMHFAVKQISKMYIQEMGVTLAVLAEKEVMKNLMHPFVTQVRNNGVCVCVWVRVYGRGGVW
jgi:CRP-like cAMP-binding protein